MISKQKSDIFRPEAIDAYANQRRKKSQSSIPRLQNKFFFTLWLLFFGLLFLLIILTLFQRVPIIVSGIAYPIANQSRCFSTESINIVVLVNRVNEKNELKAGMKVVLTKSGEPLIHTTLIEPSVNSRDCLYKNSLPSSVNDNTGIAFTKVDSIASDSEYKCYIELEDVYIYEWIINSFSAIKYDNS